MKTTIGNLIYLPLQIAFVEDEAQQNEKILAAKHARRKRIRVSADRPAIVKNMPAVIDSELRKGA